MGLQVVVVGNTRVVLVCEGVVFGGKVVKGMVVFDWGLTPVYNFGFWVGCC